MRNYPKENYEIKELQELQAEDWQIELLKLNPSYNCWGNFEDYMSDKKSNWASRMEFKTWEEFGPWKLDELNEVVNFYFEVKRETENCTECEIGYNKKTQKIYNEWYDLDGNWIPHPTKPNRNYNPNQRQLHIEQYELDALWEANRLFGYETKPTVEQLRIDTLEDKIDHDSINAHIAVKARAKHEGVYGNCPNCDGESYIYTSEIANVALQLWILHPRKGCSRGIYIENITKEDLPKVLEFLKEAEERNRERFNKVINFDLTKI